MRTARKIAIVLIALVVMTMVTALPAHAGAEGDFLSRINASRSAAGLPPVSMHSDLVPDARSHSAEMMAAGQIYHSSNLAGVASGWEALAEN
ncbi:MAG: CAP domain-containing protein, partial [Acidimicrobiia bacterium]